MGANNLIEPIDARPVFTAFSATLPHSFYSNRNPFVFIRAQPTSLSGFIVSIIGPGREYREVFFRFVRFAS